MLYFRKILTGRIMKDDIYKNTMSAWTILGKLEQTHPEFMAQDTQKNISSHGHNDDNNQRTLITEDSATESMQFSHQLPHCTLPAPHNLKNVNERDVVVVILAGILTGIMCGLSNTMEACLGIMAFMGSMLYMRSQLDYVAAWSEDEQNLTQKQKVSDTYKTSWFYRFLPKFLKSFTGASFMPASKNMEEELLTETEILLRKQRHLAPKFHIMVDAIEKGAVPQYQAEALLGAIRGMSCADDFIGWPDKTPKESIRAMIEQGQNLQINNIAFKGHNNTPSQKQAEDLLLLLKHEETCQKDSA